MWKCQECGLLQRIDFKCKKCGHKFPKNISAQKILELRKFKYPQGHWKKKKK